MGGNLNLPSVRSLPIGRGLSPQKQVQELVSTSIVQRAAGAAFKSAAKSQSRGMSSQAPVLRSAVANHIAASASGP